MPYRKIATEISKRQRAAKPLSEISPFKKGIAKFPTLKLLKLKRNSSLCEELAFRYANIPTAIRMLHVAKPIRKHQRKDGCSSRALRPFTAAAGMVIYRITDFRNPASSVLKMPSCLNPYPRNNNARYTIVCVATLLMIDLSPFPTAGWWRAVFRQVVLR